MISGQGQQAFLFWRPTSKRLISSNAHKERLPEIFPAAFLKTGS
jgi:hypothetical protein